MNKIIHFIIIISLVFNFISYEYGCSLMAQAKESEKKTVYVSEDSYVNNLDGQRQVNFGDSISAVITQVKGDAYKDYKEGTLNRIAFLKFNLKDLTDEYLSAKLYFHYNYKSTSTASLTVYGVDDDSWSEDTINYDNQPIFGDVNKINKGTVEGTGNDNSYVLYEDGIDVSSYVINQLKEDKIVSLAITRSEAVTSTRGIFIATKENDISSVSGAYLEFSKEPPAEETINYKNPLPALTPIEEHPRLFLTKDYIPVLKRNIISEPLNSIWLKILKIADEEPSSVFTSGSIAVSNALKYILNDDVKAGEKAKKLAMNSLQSATAASFEGTNYGAYKLSGPFVVACSLVYDWCYELINDEEKQTFIKHFKRFNEEILRGGYPNLTIGFNLNQEMSLKLDYLSLAIAIYNEYPEMYNIVAGAFFTEMVPILNFWYPSGWHHQGTNYGLNTRGGVDYFSSFMFKRMGLGDVLAPSLENMPYQYIYMRRPDGELISDGDYSVATLKTGEYRTNFFSVLLPAGYYQNPYFQDQLLGQGTLSTFFSVDSPYYIHNIYNILFVDPTLERKSITELPLTRYFDYPVGAMIARTGWTPVGEVNKDSKEVVAQMKLGIFNTGNHQHTDAGEFEIYYKGNLAIDSGDYQNYNSEHCQNYSQKTIAHNCMLVYDPNETFIRSRTNGGGQIVHAGYNTVEELLAEGKTGEILGHEFGPDEVEPDYSYLKGDLTDAYSDKVSEYKRSFVFLNFKNEEHPAALIVFDKMVSSDANFKKYWLLHSEEEPEVLNNIITITRSNDGYNGKLINHALLPDTDNLEINKVGGPEQEFLVFGENFPLTTVPKENQHGAGQWRIEISPKVASQEDLFLNVMQVQDNIGGPTPLTPEKIETTNMVGTKIYDRVVLFSKSGNRLKDTVTFSAGNEGESLKFVVTDLKAGVWKIKNNKNEEQYGIVTEEGNVLNFEGMAGEYTILFDNTKDIKDIKDIKENDNSKVIGFSDVKDLHWASSAILNLASKGIIKGKEKDKFYPEDTITRAEFIKILTEAFDMVDDDSECDFYDVKKEDWFYKYVASGLKNGLINGFSDNTFKADSPITREDICVFLMRAMRIAENSNDVSSKFNDFEKISDYAIGAVVKLSELKIVNGYEDNTFRPQNNATRAEAAHLINKIFEGN